MDVVGQDDAKVKKYTTPRWVQVWFLERSRDNWKRKYKVLKTEAKRLQNAVNDVKKSREKWRAEVDELRHALRDQEAVIAALQEQQAALKKDGQPAGH
jgi:SMC interacting uncharacterized protein involved in chromosome segregation